MPGIFRQFPVPPSPSDHDATSASSAISACVPAPRSLWASSTHTISPSTCLIGPKSPRCAGGRAVGRPLGREGRDTRQQRPPTPPPTSSPGLGLQPAWPASYKPKRASVPTCCGLQATWQNGKSHLQRMTRNAATSCYPLAWPGSYKPNPAPPSHRPAEQAPPRPRSRFPGAVAVPRPCAHAPRPPDAWTQVAWAPPERPDLMCAAHAAGARVVLNAGDVSGALADAVVRKAWVRGGERQGGQSGTHAAQAGDAVGLSMAVSHVV